MSRPRAGYCIQDGTRVPGVTTIVGRYKDASALMHWAWSQGRDGKDFRETSADAATAGTLAHEAVLADLRHEPMPEFPDDDIGKAAGRAFMAYLDWRRTVGLDVVEAEMPLVSEAHRFGGTPDAIASVNGKLCLVDWKTSNGVYPDYLYQLAAYAILWDENRPRDRLDGGYYLCRFAKEHGDWSVNYWPDLEEAKRGFLLMRDLYEIDAKVKKRV